MARQRKEDAEATRKRILDSARSCFLRFGFSNTSMEMIASHAGNTRGAIYWHFKSKEHILSVLTEMELAPLARQAALGCREEVGRAAEAASR
ncbi:TPA: TetR family transcriptional regulator [Stenotrophomonas maltophilia]